MFNPEFTMSLINCPDCDHKVSDQAEKCPSCGRTIKKPQVTLVGLLLAFIFVPLVLYFIMQLFS